MPHTLRAISDLGLCLLRPVCHNTRVHRVYMYQEASRHLSKVSAPGNDAHICHVLMRVAMFQSWSAVV